MLSGTDTNAPARAWAKAPTAANCVTSATTRGQHQLMNSDQRKMNCRYEQRNAQWRRCIFNMQCTFHVK